MATIVLQAAGAFLGSVLGPVGSAIGSAAGAMAGYVLDRALINSTQHIEGPRLSGPRPFTAEEGASIARVYGTARIGGTLIWATRFEESRQTTRRGFKGGPRVSEYSYFANAAFALCEGQIAGVRRIWADGRELDQSLCEIRVHEGSGDQPADPLIEVKQGAGETPAYRGLAYVVFERFPIGDYGNRIPQFQFEVLRPVGSLKDSAQAVALIPGSTEYGLSPSIVTSTPTPGETLALNRHVLHAGSNLGASLDELQALCPNIEHVALVVAWFGDDLRAGHCRVRPTVTQPLAEGFSQPWIVSGVAREGAALTSSYDGGAAYGGSPCDRSVMDAITVIRERELSVTLYPFVMMDIAAGNGLPDPHGGAEQASHPWRGRVTCDPAPGQPGSADRTAVAATQVAAFCGGAAPGDFDAETDTIAFSGDPDDWGYRRFILHYAHLAVAAGGVDAFLIGSELRGLTCVRDAAGAFPFVEQLCALADDVRSLLGPATKITYAADWSEYFGYHPQDDSGDVFFNLDPLWAHSAINAVGIDNYMPLSDWRDEDWAGGNPDGFAGPYDARGLKAAIAGGEGFDWYYASEADRRDRARTPITDGAYAKPWVYRYKDLHGWWSNPHHDRIGGVEAGGTTAWVAQSKPIWFTELGCPAVDKGPNQPNVFPDPKSTENAIPYFSNGGRSDLAQQRFLDAHMDHWRPGAAGFDDSQNPVSALYDGRMVDASRLCLWAWDARPFPAFPLSDDVWKDSANWSRGHWLNGRLSGVTTGDLVNAILADHGLPRAETSGADGALHGYVVSDPTSARNALEPVIDLFGLDVIEDGGDLVFTSEANSPRPPLQLDELVDERDGTVIESTRIPDHHLPTEAVLAFRDPLIDYQAATSRFVRPGAVGERQKFLSVPAILETGQAKALVEDWMVRMSSQRERVAFAVPASQFRIRPGSLVRLPASPQRPDYLVEQVEDGLFRRVQARQIVRRPPALWRTDLPTPLPAHTAMFGRPHVQFLDLPMGPGSGGPHEQLRLAVRSKPWKSQIVFASPEPTGFARRASVDRPAFMGRLTEPAVPGVIGRFDRMGALMVELFDGELSSATELQVLNGANAAALRATNGVWEIIQFKTAEEIAPSVWRLTGLLRAQLGTDDATLAGASSGAAFVVLDDAVRPAGLRPNETGLALNWRVGPAGQDFSSAHFDQQTLAGGLRSRLPLSPVHIAARRMTTGDFDVTWIRRSRIDADAWADGDVPLGEEAERYRISIGRIGGSPLRVAETSSPNFHYSAGAIAADFAALPAEATVTVQQWSHSAGWGLPGSATVTFY